MFTAISIFFCKFRALTSTISGLACFTLLILLILPELAIAKADEFDLGPDGKTSDSKIFKGDAEERSRYIESQIKISHKKQQELEKNALKLILSKEEEPKPLKKRQRFHRYPIPRYSKDRSNRSISLDLRLAEAVAPTINPCATLTNPIQIENCTMTGTNTWRQSWSNGQPDQIESKKHEIEGYASATSVNKGETIRFYVNTLDTSYTWALYRLGWYGGTGAREVISPTLIQASTGGSLQQPLPSPVGVTVDNNGNTINDINNLNYGLVDAGSLWKESFNITTGANWVSGVYLIKLQTTNTFPWQNSAYKPYMSYIIFVVRDDGRASDYLFQSSVTTFQAYNTWGGKSLYSYSSSAGLPAYKVSFNRPYSEGAGAGHFFYWEENAMHFLEREGYDVTYCTNIDIHHSSAAATKPRAFLSVGHDEYWTWQQRINLENARELGISLGFLGSNNGYWQIRLEDGARLDPSTNAEIPIAYRTVVSYKENAYAKDPYATNGITTDDYLITTLWRSGSATRIPRPEDSLIGTMYYGDSGIKGHIETTNPGSWNVPAQSTKGAIRLNKYSWIYDGTTAATIVASGGTGSYQFKGLYGYEGDTASAAFSTPPAGTEIIAHTRPVVENLVSEVYSATGPMQYSTPIYPDVYPDMTLYRWPLTSTLKLWPYVFSSGSMQWNWGLDDETIYVRCSEAKILKYLDRIANLYEKDTCNATASPADLDLYVGVIFTDANAQQMMRNVLAKFKAPDANPVAVNVALGKAAKQSSNYSSLGVAGKAVDNNTNGNYFAGSVTHTGYNTNAWWQVDLAAGYPISTIQLSNRTDCCASRLANFYVFVSNTDMTGRSLTSLVNDASIWRYRMSNQAPTNLSIPVNTNGRYVRVQLAGTNYLSLAEVQVFARQ